MQVEEEEDDNDESDSGIETEEKSLDVRAGRVDVVLHELKFDAAAIMALFEKYRFKEFTNGKSRRAIKAVLTKYRRYADGDFPLGTRRIETARDVREKFEPFDADAKAEELLQLEEQMVEESAYLPPKVKRKLEWKKKRLHSGANDDDEQPKKKAKVEKNPLEVKPLKKKKKPAPIDFNPLEKPLKKKKETSGANLLEKLSPKKKKKPKNTETNPLEQQPPKKSKKNAGDDWSRPLEDGEVEIFLPSRKNKLKEANNSLKKKRHSLPAKSEAINIVKNPFASAKKEAKVETTPCKRVKIVLQKNTAQDSSEYIATIKNSPQVPWDSSKKPTKGLLKPNLLPSPINPFYKKRIGLKLDSTL